jgi:hypothetical protein
MNVDDRGWTEFSPSDFLRHGFLATYILGGCRCVPCTARILAPDQIKDLPANYAGDYRRNPK